MRVYIVFYEFFNGMQTSGVAVKYVHKVVEATLPNYMEFMGEFRELLRDNPRLQFEFIARPDVHYLKENWLNDRHI